MTAFLLIALFASTAAAVYFYGRHQLLAAENVRLLEDNAALRDKVLAKHGFTPLHEAPEVANSRRQSQVIDIRPPIHAAIAIEEEAEEREYMLSREKQAELVEEARRRAS